MNLNLDDPREETRRQIIASSIDLLHKGGRDAVTTRAVAEAAGVQGPTIYRLFGDKNGLLDAVANHGFTTYLGRKGVSEPGPDPVADLRRVWDLHVGFGLSHPAIYQLIYAEPRPGVRSPAAQTCDRFLKEQIRRIAAVGRLSVPEERAVDLFHACASGTVLTLLSQADGQRDPSLSGMARAATMAAITTGAPAFPRSGLATAAVALLAVLPEAKSLSDAERSLLMEWLNRIATIDGERI